MLDRRGIPSEWPVLELNSYQQSLQGGIQLGDRYGQAQTQTTNLRLAIWCW